MNTLVQEDKIKFPSSVSKFCINNDFMVFVLENQPKTLRIRHMYNQSLTDMNTNYPNCISTLKLTNSNHVVMVDQMNQVDISYLKIQSQIKLVGIKGFQKKGLVDVVVANNMVAMLCKDKLHVLALKEETIAANIKQDFSGTPLKGVFTEQNLYVLFVDQSVRKYTKSPDKFEQLAPDIQFKDQIIDIKTIVNSEKDYLIYVTKEKQIRIVSQDGRAVDIMSYEGQFKEILVIYQMLIIVSAVKETNVFTVYYAAQNYDLQISRPFFNKSESYSRNAKYNAWGIVPILKNEWTVYSRRKGTKQVHHVNQITQETFCLIYGRVDSDPTKLELLKIDAAKILNKDRQSLQIRQSEPQHQSLKEAPSLIKQNSKIPSNKIQLSQASFKAFEHILSERVTPLISRINNIEQKIIHLQSKVNSMNSSDLTKLYSSIVEKQVIGLFETKIVPKMEQFFNNVFEDLGRVFKTGIEYYSEKLNAESVLQKNTFDKLLHYTQTLSKDIVDVMKNDLPQTAKINQMILQCLKKKEELLKTTQQLLTKVEKGPFSYKPSTSPEKEKQPIEEEEKNKTPKTEEKKGKKTFVKSDLI